MNDVMNASLNQYLKRNQKQHLMIKQLDPSVLLKWYHAFRL